MPSLLDLPREIRDDIIELAISHLCKAPNDPAEALASGCYGSLGDMTGWLSRKSLSTFGTAEPVMYPVPGSPITPLVDPTSLMSTSHQLRAETLDAIRRIPRNVEVDVILVDEEFIIATWTRVPPMALRVWFQEKLIREPDTLAGGVDFTVRCFGNWGYGPQRGPGHRGEWPIDFDRLSRGPAAVLFLQHFREGSGFSITQGVDTEIIPGKALMAFSLLFERFLRGGASGVPFPATNYDLVQANLTATVMILSPPGVPKDRLFEEGTSTSFVHHERLSMRHKRDWMLHPKSIEATLTEWFMALPTIEQDPTQPLNLSQLLRRVTRVEFGTEGVLDARYDWIDDLGWEKSADEHD